MKANRFTIFILVLFLATGCSVIGGLAGPTATPEPTPTPTLTPEQARAGDWGAATEFGSFTFTVSDDGASIVGFGAYYSVGIISGSIDPQGEFALPIEDNAFVIPLGDGQIEGQFSDDGTSAEGVWEMSIPLAGDFSEEWVAER